jgi:hypothetical protein
MQPMNVQVTIARTDQMMIELELQTLFGIQVDDMFPAEREQEIVLRFSNVPDQVARYLRQKKDQGLLREVALEGDNDETEKEERGDQPTYKPQEIPTLAQAALGLFSQEWVQRGFGAPLSAFMVDVLTKYLPNQQPEPQVTPYRDYVGRLIKVGDVIAGTKNGQMMVAIVRDWTDKSLLIDELLRDGHYDWEQGSYISTGMRLWRTSLRLPRCCFVTGQTEGQLRRQFAFREVISRY